MVGPFGEVVSPFRSIVTGVETAPPRWGGETLVLNRTSIFDLWSRPWGVARPLGLRGGTIPRKGSGSTTTTPLHFTYLYRIKRKENSSYSACRICNLSLFGASFLAQLLFIFDLWSRPWNVALLLVLAKFPPSFPLLGRNWVAYPTLILCLVEMLLHVDWHYFINSIQWLVNLQKCDYSVWIFGKFGRQQKNNRNTVFFQFVNLKSEYALFCFYTDKSKLFLRIHAKVFLRYSLNNDFTQMLLHVVTYIQTCL